jgi:hypothetical protein
MSINDQSQDLARLKQAFIAVCSSFTCLHDDENGHVLNTHQLLNLMNDASELAGYASNVLLLLQSEQKGGVL